MSEGGGIIPIRDHQLRRVAVPHIGPNDEWALNNLPIVRIASVILTSSQEKLEEVARELDDREGSAAELLSDLNQVACHLMDIVEALQAARELTTATLAKIRS